MGINQVHLLILTSPKVEGVIYFVEAKFLVQPTICKTAEDVDQVKNHVSNMFRLHYIMLQTNKCMSIKYILLTCICLFIT
jgi:hypothetical protein